MLILGLNAFHPDSAACALKDGRLVAAVAEERLGPRLRHVAGFLGRALVEVLRMAGATLRDVGYVAVGNDSNANLQAKAAHMLRSPLKSVRGVLTHFQRRAKLRSFRERKKDYLHFHYIARGSLSETQSFVHLAHRLGYLSGPDAELLTAQTRQTFACLHGLIKAVEKEAGKFPKAVATITSLLVIGCARLAHSPVVP